MDWLKEKENLENLINNNNSYESIGRLYNCTGNTIKKACIKLDIPLKIRRKTSTKETFNKGKSKKIKFICQNCGKEFIRYKDIDKNKFCCKKCFGEYNHKTGYERVLNNDPSIMYPEFHIQQYKKDIIKEQGGKCAICKIEEFWNNKKLIFILDHIDGRASNNSRNNLRAICPNCDSQLDTYKSKNKNSDRTYYRINKR